MNAAIRFTLSYEGHEADSSQIDLYDISQALIGFQRSLALTAHLVVNGEIITQSPSLKGARILATPPEEGSWKITAVVIAGLYAATTAPKDTPLGHVIYSAYDYVVSESLGFHVDYDKTLGQLYEEHKKNNLQVPRVEQHQLDSLIEKCTHAITEIHRPIVRTETATSADIVAIVGSRSCNIGGPFTRESFEYIHEVFISDLAEVVEGRVTSYNSNTYKGRIYVASEGRPVAFELAEGCRSNSIVQIVVASLSVNAVKDYKSEWSNIHFKVFKNTSRSGHLKSYSVIQASHTAIQSQ